MFMRKHGATSHHLTEDGTLVLTRGIGEKMEQLKVTASRLAAVEERIKSGLSPTSYELQATLLGVRARPKGQKPNQGKRLR